MQKRDERSPLRRSTEADGTAAAKVFASGTAEEGGGGRVYMTSRFGLGLFQFILFRDSSGSVLEFSS